ncbi:MAG: 30S ribosomal protein S2 [Patescibacteria group bacterium]
MTDFSKLPNHAPDYDLQQLLEAGCHFGHQKRKWHPKMAEYIYMEKNGVHIFDLVKTAAQLQTAYNYAYQLGKEGKTVIFVGTKRQAREVVRTAAEKAGVFHITQRWMGGLLTNWEQINKSIRRMIEIEEGLKTDKFKGYTKFERMQLEKEKGRLERFFEGVRGLKDKPVCLFVIDPNREKIAVTEASKMGVSVVALADSNANPDLVDLVVPANDDAVNSVELIVNQIAEGYLAGKSAK